MTQRYTRADREKALAAKAHFQARDREEAKAMTRNWTEKLALYGIPKRMHPGIVRYVEEGVPPGHFLLAVLSNALLEACARGDDENVQLLGDYAKLLINQLPPDSYGSGQHVRDWIKRGGIKGNATHEPLPEHQWSRWAV